MNKVGKSVAEKLKEKGLLTNQSTIDKIKADKRQMEIDIALQRKKLIEGNNELSEIESGRLRIVI